MWSSFKSAPHKIDGDRDADRFMGKSDFMSWRVIRARTDNVQNESFDTPGGDQSNERFRSEEIWAVVAIASLREQRKDRLVLKPQDSACARRDSSRNAISIPVTQLRS